MKFRGITEDWIWIIFGIVVVALMLFYALNKLGAGG